MRSYRHFLSVITAMLCLFIISCSQPKALVYQDAKNFRLNNINFKEPEVGMDLQFYNPNTYPLTLKDANIDVYLNNKMVGKAVLNNTFTVPATDTFLMPVNLTANIEQVFANTLQIVFNKEVDVRLVGSVQAGRGLFIRVPINYQGRHRLNILGR
jgi:LEA14-like dessication related protein